MWGGVPSQVAVALQYAGELIDGSLRATSVLSEVALGPGLQREHAGLALLAVGLAWLAGRRSRKPTRRRAAPPAPYACPECGAVLRPAGASVRWAPWSLGRGRGLPIRWPGGDGVLGVGVGVGGRGGYAARPPAPEGAATPTTHGTERIAGGWAAAPGDNSWQGIARPGDSSGEVGAEAEATEAPEGPEQPAADADGGAGAAGGDAAPVTKSSSSEAPER